MVKVLFVCLGNICRSPMAEGLFKDRIKQLNLEKHIQVASRATSSWEIGNPPHQGTVKLLKSLSIDTKNMVAKKINAKDFIDYDYIIGMDESNVDDLIRLSPKLGHKVYLYLSVLEDLKIKSIPDPYYTHDFNETYTLINQAIDIWIEKFKNHPKF